MSCHTAALALPSLQELLPSCTLHFHLQDCLAAEEQEPMLPKLQAVLENKTRIVSMSAVVQFKKLLQQFGGLQERQRWQALQETLTIFCCDIYNQEPFIQLQADDEQPEPNATHATQTCTFADSDGRVSRLQAISDAQKQVFALGDDQRALTLTANGKASEFAARQGVQLEVFVHRAVWLTGK